MSWKRGRGRTREGENFLLCTGFMMIQRGIRRFINHRVGECRAAGRLERVELAVLESIRLRLALT